MALNLPSQASLASAHFPGSSLVRSSSNLSAGTPETGLGSPTFQQPKPKQQVQQPPAFRPAPLPALIVPPPPVVPLAPMYEHSLLPLIVLTYEGSVRSGIFHGLGTAKFVGGHSYTGAFENGLIHGKGLFVWSDGVQFEGDFVNNTISGSGVYRWPDGSVYTGSIVAGKRDGLGTFRAPDGSEYTGEWHQGRRHGKGTLKYASGDVYEGQWVSNLRQGHGKLLYSSGNEYTGEWMGGLRHGRGRMVWHDRQEEYSGEWVKGVQHGQGEHIWKRTREPGSQYVDHNHYQGTWVNGKRHGRGEYFYASGAKYSGEWQDNCKHGEGTFTYENGFVFRGRFVHDAVEGNVDPAAFAVFSAEALGLPTGPDTVDLERVVVRNLTSLHTLYNKYARCAPPSLENVYLLSRLQFHRLLKDARLFSRGLSLGQADGVIGPSPPLHSDPLLMRDVLGALIRIASRINTLSKPSEAFSQLLSEAVLPLNGAQTAVGGVFLSSPALLPVVLQHATKLEHAFRRHAAGSTMTARQVLLLVRTAHSGQGCLSATEILQVLRSDNPHLFSDEDDCNLDSEMVFLEYLELLIGCAFAQSKCSSDSPDLDAVAAYLQKLV